MDVALAVMCKAPVPGRVKTRLSPPCSRREAAALAEAALRDTFDAVRAAPAARRVAVVDGGPGDWIGEGIEVTLQRGHRLDERLAAALDDLAGAALVIGMDTPQVTAGLLGAGLRAVAERGSALGPARDGGYWAIGLARPDARAVLGIPMSSARTAAAQRARLAELGLVPAELEPLADVDDIASAREVAATAPHTRFARLLHAMGHAQPA